MTTEVMGHDGYDDQPTLTKTATLVAAQGSWRWQQRLRMVRYAPTRLSSGRIVWGTPITVNHGISGGNLRSPLKWDGEPSPLWLPLSPGELVTVGLYRLRVFGFKG